MGYGKIIVGEERIFKGCDYRPRSSFFFRINSSSVITPLSRSEASLSSSSKSVEPWMPPSGLRHSPLIFASTHVSECFESLLLPRCESDDGVLGIVIRFLFIMPWGGGCPERTQYTTAEKRGFLQLHAQDLGEQDVLFEPVSSAPRSCVSRCA